MMNLFSAEFVGGDMHWVCQEVKLDLLYEDSLKTVLSVTPSVNVGSLEHYMEACRTSGPQGEHKTYCMYKA